MARPRYTTRFTIRLDPALRDDLQCEAVAKGDDFATLVRDVLSEHAARRFIEQTRQDGRR